MTDRGYDATPLIHRSAANFLCGHWPEPRIGEGRTKTGSLHFQAVRSRSTLSAQVGLRTKPRAPGIGLAFTNGVANGSPLTLPEPRNGPLGNYERVRFTGMPNDSSHDPSIAIAAVLDLLVRQGYETTSVEELADAAGISRSTFFRKYGSKEGMVFADHDRILRQLNDHLTYSTGDPLQAIADAAAMVFDHHLHHKQTALARYQLLQQVPALRDRELVTSYSYERAFRLHLQATLPENARRDYGAIAVSAAMVAVHNAFLRQWLRSPEGVPAAELRSRLKGELTALAETFRVQLYGAGSSADRAPAVMVTVFDPGTSKQNILDAINRAIA